MTIDERLDRLTARHEALSESVEILLASVRQLRASFPELHAVSTDIRATSKGDDGVDIRPLARIAERRLTALEGGAASSPE
jgi:prefoldin subunit 5